MHIVCQGVRGFLPIISSGDFGQLFCIIVITAKIDPSRFSINIAWHQGNQVFK